MDEIGKRQHKENPSQAGNYSDSGTYKAHQQDAGNGTKKEEHNQEPKSRGLTRFLKSVNDYSGALLVAFTAVLALATWYLWSATRDLVKGSERVGDRQVREMKKSAD